MRYLLDTNAWVDYLNQRYPTVAERIWSTDPDDLSLSSVVLAELRYGADKSQFPARNHARLDVLVQDVPSWNSMRPPQPPLDVYGPPWRPKDVRSGPTT